MLIRVTSDLHTDFYNNKIIKPLKEVLPPLSKDSETTLVIAGDISTSFQSLDIVRILSKRFKHIVFCLGNHDYYDSSLDKMHYMANELCQQYKNIHFLEKSSVAIDGVTFAGGTLWSDFSLFYTPKSSADLARCYVNDFKFIKNSQNKALQPQDTILEFYKTVKFLKTLNYKEKLVIVSHHAPSSKSVKIDMLYNSLSPAYVSNLEELIREIQPKYWIHGHLHGYSNYNIGDCRVIQNCFGYYKYDENGMYNNKLVVDI